jgi:riboflavin kinase / FMN adenylyltransferase
MQLIENINDIKTDFKNSAVTIGNFDGVHIAHKALFSAAIDAAKEIKGKSIAVTFYPHPLKVLKIKKDVPLITPHYSKVELIEETGIDILICIKFDNDFASISAENFVEKIIKDKLGAKFIIVGDDYTFGKNRKGNIKLLKNMGKSLGFETRVINELETSEPNPIKIRSTNIRNMIKAGEVFEVRKLLGRFFQIKGKVIKGRKRGGKLVGFATANIMQADVLYPKIGVYATIVECLGVSYNAVSNIGVSPSFGDNIFTIETHLIDFDKDIYDEEIRVTFIKRIRDEKKFLSIEKLSEAIKKDIEKAKEILSCQY